MLLVSGLRHFEALPREAPVLLGELCTQDKPPSPSHPPVQTRVGGMRSARVGGTIIGQRANRARSPNPVNRVMIRSDKCMGPRDADT